MAIIKITIMGNDIQTTHNLLSYSFQPTDVEQATFLEINTSVSSINYRIWADENAKDINKIKSFISSQFDNALINNNIIYLREEPSRDYIYFCNDNEIIKQFGGRRI